MKNLLLASVRLRILEADNLDLRSNIAVRDLLIARMERDLFDLEEELRKWKPDRAGNGRFAKRETTNRSQS